MTHLIRLNLGHRPGEPPNPLRPRVEIDGHELAGFIGLTVIAGPDRLTHVTLHLNADVEIDVHGDLAVARYPLDGLPPSSDTKMILAAIERMNDTMAESQSKTAAALAALQADVAAETTVIASATTLINGFPAAVQAAVADALAGAGVDDATTAAALAAVDANMQAAVAPLQAAVSANTPPAAPPASPPPPPPPPVISPSSISGVAGQALTGAFTLTPPADGVTWSATDNPPDIDIASDGTISGVPVGAEAGDMKVDARDAAGNLLAEALVPYTISAADAAS